MHVSRVLMVIVALSGTASAQWATSITRPLFGENAAELYRTDIPGENTALLDVATLGLPGAAQGFTGLAGDPIGGRLIASTNAGSSTGLYAIDYQTLEVSFLTSTRDSLEVGGGPLIDGLAFNTSSGELWAAKRLNTGGAVEGLYTIDLDSGLTTLQFAYPDPADFDISGIDYDPDSGMIYLANEDSERPGIYSFDPSRPNDGLSLEFPFPAGVTDVDGLGAGGGQLFLLSDGTELGDPAAGNGGFHYVVDIVTGSLISTQATPYPQYTEDSIFGSINPTGGAAYAPELLPEPSSMVLLCLLGVLRRR